MNNLSSIVFAILVLLVPSGDSTNNKYIKLIDTIPFSEGHYIIPPYPQPFGYVTEYKFNIANNAKVKINIYDAEANHIRELLNSELNPGFYTIDWNRKDHLEQSVKSGIYYLIIEVVSTGQNITEEYKGVIKIIIIN